MADMKITVPQDRIADFCRRNQIRRLEVFGSVLREDFGPNSDVDVLVEFEPEAQVGFIALSRMRRELGELLQRPVDLVPRGGLKPRIREAVLSSMAIHKPAHRQDSEVYGLTEEESAIVEKTTSDRGNTRWGMRSLSFCFWHPW